ncbi:hypothetical protein GQ607_014804, partial [Colletotrichum asianum]
NICDPDALSLLMALARSQRQKLMRAGGPTAENRGVSGFASYLDMSHDVRLHVHATNIPATSHDRLADFSQTSRALTCITLLAIGKIIDL